MRPSRLRGRIIHVKRKIAKVRISIRKALCTCYPLGIFIDSRFSSMCEAISRVFRYALSFTHFGK